MNAPLQAIAAEGAQLAAQVRVAPAVPSFLSNAWAKLRAPSPRSDVELSEDLVAQILNDVLDAKTAGASSPAKMGEAVADCAYALTEVGGSPGASSPIGRLFKATKAMLGTMRHRAMQAHRAQQVPGEPASP